MWHCSVANSISFSCFGPKSWGMSFLLGHTVLHEFILCLFKSSKSLGDEKKLSINILCPKPSTLQVKCLTVVCVAVMSSVVECESVPKYTLMYFFCNVLPEDNPALEFYNHLIHCQMLWGIIELSISIFSLSKTVLSFHSQSYSSPLSGLCELSAKCRKCRMYKNLSCVMVSP